MNLSFITSNPMIKKMLFKQVEEAFTKPDENGRVVTAIVIKPGAGGQLDENSFEVYREPVVILNEQKFNDLKTSLKNEL